MSDNPHFEEASVLLADKTGEYEPGQYEIEKSKALATLALAYEQRTANLIAYEAGLARAFRDNAINENGIRLWKLAADEVHERLGLS